MTSHLLGHPLPTNQFDQTTEHKHHTQAFKQGRNSCRESMEILARAVLEHPCNCGPVEPYGNFMCWRCETKSKVIHRGDWPLPEESK